MNNTFPVQNNMSDVINCEMRHFFKASTTACIFPCWSQPIREPALKDADLTVQRLHICFCKLVHNFYFLQIKTCVIRHTVFLCVLITESWGRRVIFYSFLTVEVNRHSIPWHNWFASMMASINVQIFKSTDKGNWRNSMWDSIILKSSLWCPKYHIRHPQWKHIMTVP